MTDPQEPEPFTLVGGPGDGEVVIVSRCIHGDWPDLNGTTGRYRLKDDTRLYVWHSDDDQP